MTETIHLKDVKIGMCLAEPVFSKNNFLLYNKNFYFTSRDQIIKLLDYGISEVKINVSQSLVDSETKHRDIKSEYEIKKSVEDPIKKYERIAANVTEVKELFDEGDKIIHEFMDAVRFGKNINQQAITEETTKIVKAIKEDPLVAMALLDLKHFNEYTLIHSINVAVLSVAFAFNLKFGEEILSSIAQGSLLHDIGKAKIPVDILNKPDKLSDMELRIIQKHPELGIQALGEDNLHNPIVKEIILHHHENYDGTGYPSKLAYSETKRFASIVSIADYYDALTSQRSYKDIVTPADAVKKIYSLSGTKFDPRVVNHFVKTIGIYPIGSIAELSDDRISVVVAFTKENLLQPIVKTLYHKSNPEIPNIEIISLSESELYIKNLVTDMKIKTMDVFKK